MTATVENKPMNFETDWDVPVSGPSDNADFLRLKDKESAVIRVMSKPFGFKEHWHDKRSVMCGKDQGIPCALCGTVDEEGKPSYPRKRFAVAVFVHAAKLGGADKNEPVDEPRIFEMSGRAFQALQGAVTALKEEGVDYREKDFTVARSGDGTDTTYTFTVRQRTTPLPDGVETPDLNALYEARLKKHANAPDLPATTSEFDPFADQ